jgi:hypothetical protein
MALSHCWGKEPIITTTKATLQDRMREFQISAPPKTFQDAIAITNGLGIQYLRIDSLCIIQDDLQDWEGEASKMAGIYAGSKFNIAATHASDGQGDVLASDSHSTHGTRLASIWSHGSLFNRRKQSQLLDYPTVSRFDLPYTLLMTILLKPRISLAASNITAARSCVGLSRTTSCATDTAFSRRRAHMGMQPFALLPMLSSERLHLRRPRLKWSTNFEIAA